MRLKAKMLVFMPGREVKRYVHVYTRKDGSERAQWVGPEDFKTGEGRKLYPGLVKEDRFVFTDQVHRVDVQAFLQAEASRFQSSNETGGQRSTARLRSDEIDADRSRKSGAVPLQQEGVSV